MFEKSLTDLIKGIRANPPGEADFISTCMAECRTELQSVEASTKQMAVVKLTYLQMLGHDVSWAAFHFVEVMAAPRFRGKRIGFLGASQTFNDSTDVMLLTTSLFRKAFASSTQHEASIAVGCLARIATTDLSRDLIQDVTNMLGSSRPLLRKKAVLALYRLLQKLPEALVPAFPRLRERLDDPDPSVVACTVNVLTELATDNPRGYLGLAPALYKVLTTSSSNWTLIKVVKFLRQLVPHEPRLAKKLVQPLTHLIETTPAKSLQFECLYTVATTMASSQPELASLAASKLREFVEAPDPNLKSLGLLALAALQATDKALIEPCRDAVLKCLDDEASVRAAALSLIAGMVTRASLVELVHKLLSQIEGASASYRDEVVAVILSSVRADGFAHVPSFRWLITTLFTVAALDTKHGTEVARLTFEVSLRVPTVRAFAAEQSLDRLLKLQQGGTSAADTMAATNTPAAAPPEQPPQQQPSDAAVLAASYVIGEHSSLLPPTTQQSALLALLAPNVLSLSPEVQASCVQSAVRVLTNVPEVITIATGSNGSGSAELATLLSSLSGWLLPFCASSHPEVAERARGAHALCTLIANSDSSSKLLRSLREGMAGDLKAVAPKAQRKVKPPVELDLTTPIYTPTQADWEALGVTGGGGNSGPASRPQSRAAAATPPPQQQDASPAVEVSAERPPPKPRPGAVGPYYLPAEPSSKAAGAPPSAEDAASSWQPSQPPQQPPPSSEPAAAAAMPMAPSTTSFGDEDEIAGAVVDLHEDMPDGAEHSDEEKDNAPADAAEPIDVVAAAAAAQQQQQPHQPPQPPSGGGGPMLVDLLGGAEPQADASEEGGKRRRRRKHRSGGEGGDAKEGVLF